MREGLRFSNLRKGEKVESDLDAGDMGGEKVPNLNVKEGLDVGLSGKERRCRCEVSKNNGNFNGSLCGRGLGEGECKDMEAELQWESVFHCSRCSGDDDCERKEPEGGLDDRVGGFDGNLKGYSEVTVDAQEEFYDCSEILGGATEVGGEGKEAEVSGLNCSVGTVDQVMVLSSVALEHVDKDINPKEANEKNMQSNNGIDDQASKLEGVEIHGTDDKLVVYADKSNCSGVDVDCKVEEREVHVDCGVSTVRSNFDAVMDAHEKVDGIEGSDCKFDEDEKDESLKIKAELGRVQVGKVLRSRIVPANCRAELAGGGQFKVAKSKRKSVTDGPGEGVVTVKEESDKSVVDSEKGRKRGRPKRTIHHSEEEVIQISKVQVNSETEDEDEDVKKKLVKTRKKKGKRGRPKKSVDPPEEEVLQLNNVPFISDAEDDVVEKKGKRGRPKKSVDLPEEVLQLNNVPFISDAEDDVVEKKGKRGRPKKSVDPPEEEVLQLHNVPFISDAEDDVVENKTVKAPKQEKKRGRPKKFVDSPEGKLVQTNKFQVKSNVEHEDLDKKSAKSSKKKGKRGRPRKLLDCPDGEVDCDVDDKAVDLSKKSVEKLKLERKRGRPRRDVAAPEEVVQVKKVQFQEVDEFTNENEELSNRSVQKLKTKRKRGRPKKEEGSSMLKMSFHNKGKVKNDAKMKGSLVAVPVRRGRHNIHPDIVLKDPSNGVIGMKRKRVEKVGSLSAEKNLIRNQIVNMLLAAGWTIEYRPRQGREYNDAVYVNQEGKTHWSVTKAYFTIKQEFEDGKLVSAAAKSDFCFTPVPEEILSKLFRVVSKTRSDKNKKKKHKDSDAISDEENIRDKKGGKHRHSAMKRKPSIQSGSQNKRRCALLVRRSKNSESDGIVCHSGKHSILSWMIDSGTIPLNGKVLYMMKRRRTRGVLEGSITRDGIHCHCCNEVISVSEFEKHAGGKLCEPYENLHLESGSSLLQCQLDSWNKQEESGRSGFHSVPVDGDDPNDDTCGICGDGGDLVCCDGCPSTFHNDCLDVEEVPSGEWNCVYCSCKFCGGVGEAVSDCDEDFEPPSSSLVSCSLCEEKFHQSCIVDEDVCNESRQPIFCGRHCEQIFARFQSLVGAKRDLGDGFSCTLLQRTSLAADTCLLQPRKILNNSKLALALSIMDECFLPILDHRSGINLIRHIVYNCGSNFKRLNFSGFFTVVLERGDEVISAASIRIIGKKLAEMPFIGTRNVYRRQGMCRRLLNAIELALSSLDVENLIIPAIPELMQTWTSVFGFKPMDESLKEEMRSMSLLVFPHTDMLKKPLSNQQLVQKSIATTEEDVKCVESGNEHIDGGAADKSEVDDGCPNGAFDLNCIAPNLPELANEGFEGQPEEAPPLMDSPERIAQNPDLNLTVENVCEDSPGMTHVDSSLENGDQDLGSRTLNFDLNLVQENMSEFNKLPSDLVGH